MSITREDVEEFFKLVLPLQLFVNQRKKVFPEITDLSSLKNELSIPEKGKLRNVLWENPNLIDEYVSTNPNNLSTKKLEEIDKWKSFKKGDFFIFRFLKDCAIFMEGADAYLVNHLREPFETMFSGANLPIYVKAILLPYKGEIVFDGFCQVYNMSFGSGISQNLREDYMKAKQNDRIITSFEPQASDLPEKGKKKVLDPVMEKIVNDILKASSKLKGGTAVQNAFFGVLKSSAKASEGIISNPKNRGEVNALARQICNACNRMIKAIEREDM
ncbi:MAG: hypothetical protein HQM08_07205 [Candidatus Riflebacteria bacterium]|nr:hypothetical protein [Candidatus Riflebacteria bacterium]